ncbi:MAG: Cof-type HAD-IIB family hydrolase [Chitinispirillaceae bacterium]|nr:Cof-type HAD-IIB family hydrolase [Chitinispirillaceae bacterium]
MKNYIIKKKPRLFAFDLDGTLLNNKKELSSSVLMCLEEIASWGSEIVFASGRIKSSISKYTEMCKFPISIISLNGASVFCHTTEGDKQIYSSTLSSEYADALIDYSEKNEIALNYYINEKLYAVKTKGTEEWLQLYIKETGSIYNYLSSFDSFRGSSPSKIIFIGAPETLDFYQQYFTELWKNSVYICRTWKYYLEFLNPKANKGIALQKVADYYNVPLEEVVAFGDSDNDIPMLKIAGTGIAVKNSTPALIEVAHRVSPFTNDEEAVSYECRLIKESFSGI